MESRNYKNVVIIVLVIFLIILGFQITNRQSTIDNFEAEVEQTNLLLNGEGKAAGYTCGVLSVAKAQQILGVKDVKRDYGQGPANKIREDKYTESLFWSDNCRYQVSANSNSYVEFYVATFIDAENAEKHFDDFLPIVGESVEQDPKGFGSRLVYDSGAYYLLKDNKVIQVSANNTSIDSIEVFSYSALAELIKSTDL